MGRLTSAVPGVVLAVMLGACASAPTVNQAVAKQGRHVVWKEPLAEGTFCQTCEQGQPLVRLVVGTPAKLRVDIPSCYAHARSRVGDHDHIRIVRLPDEVAATAGEVDIRDCTTVHVVGSLWATFADGVRVEAHVDTPLRHR